MIGQTHALFYELIEDAMAKKPTKSLKGFPVGKSYDAIVDERGKMVVKPKRKPPGRTLNQKYASKNRKKWKGVTT